MNRKERRTAKARARGTGASARRSQRATTTAKVGQDAYEELASAVEALTHNYETLVHAALVTDGHVTVLQRLFFDMDRDAVLRKDDGSVDRDRYYKDYNQVARVHGQLYWASGLSVDKALELAKLEIAAEAKEVEEASETYGDVPEEVFGGDYGKNDSDETPVRA